MYHFIQTIISALLFVIAVAGIASHALMGHIHGLDWLLAAFFVIATGYMLRTSFREYLQDIRN